MRTLTLFALPILLACGHAASAQAPGPNAARTSSGRAVVPNATLVGKVMTGYQGWFNAAGDGAGRGWRHWAGQPPRPGEVTVDMWPDMREADPDERFATGFKHRDGRASEVFSSYKEKTVLRHFKWMRDYGLDGVFLQRFATEVSNENGRRNFNTVLQSARKGARQYGRVYGVMYDLSGVREGGASAIIADWKALVDEMRLTRDDRYVRHNGKPVVALWGLGFSEGGRPALLDDGLQIVKFLKDDPIYGGNTVMLGVPYRWRTTDSAEVPFAKMESLLLAADIVSPWAVGTTGTPEGAAENAAQVLKPDLDWCRARGKDYMPVVFPGFGWFNLRRGKAPSNQIPRLGGRFLWTQYVEAKKQGANMLYQAMFDEVDEGTAIFKVTNDVPDGEGKSQFVPLEGLPSDFYLKLVGQGARLLRGEIRPEDDALVKNARWTPFVPAIPVAKDPQPQTQAQSQAAAEPQDLALGKKYVSSDANASGWDSGLTDGSWLAQRASTYATGKSAALPKTVTLDLEAPLSIGYVALGVPPFGSTKTVRVSLSTDNQNFTEIGSHEFALRKEEKFVLAIAPAVARYVRLTYADRYQESVQYPPAHAFTTEVAVYAPGAAPVLPPTLPPEKSDVASPKRGKDGQVDAGFLKQHELFLARAKGGPIDLLFIGDSITNGWRAGGKDVWDKYFGAFSPANFGIGGDRTQHVLWRIENGELEGIGPRVVVLLIGTNNIGGSPEEILAGDRKIVDEIRRRLPGSKLLLLGIFPRGALASDPARAKIQAVNAELAKLDDGARTRFLDIGSKFLDADGSLPRPIMPDGLHPNAAGYQIWADAMQPLLAEMMRP